MRLFGHRISVRCALTLALTLSFGTGGGAKAAPPPPPQYGINVGVLPGQNSATMTPNPIPDGADAAWVHVTIYGKDGWHVLDSHLEAPDLVMSWQRVSKIWYKGYYDGMNPGGSFALKVHGTLTRPGPRGTPPEFWLTVQGTLAEPPYYVLPPKAVKPIHDKAEFTAYYLKNPQKSTWSSHLEGGQWQSAGQGASKKFSENVAGWYEIKAEHVSEPYSDTASLCFVAPEQLLTGQWYPVQIVTQTEPAYVAAGSEAWFGVIATPSGADWPAGKPVWTATGDAQIRLYRPPDRNATFIEFPKACEKLEQPEWIEVECGNTLQGKVIVAGCKFEETLAAQYATWVASGHAGSFRFKVKLRPEGLNGYFWLNLLQGGQSRWARVIMDQAGGDLNIDWDGTFQGGSVSWADPIMVGASWQIRDADGSTLITVVDREDLYPQFLDLDIDTNGDGSVTAADEAGELSPGAFLGVNDDDDNHNGTPDKDDPGAVTGEDDLRQLVIQKVVPDGFAGALTLYFDDRVVTVYRGSDRTDLVPARQTFTQAELPKTLWIEGKSPGVATIQIGASGGGEVKVTATVVGVEVDGFVYGEDDRKIENIHTLSPAYVISHGYLQLRAKIQPASLASSLYYQWTKTDGTFDGDTDGAGSTYTQVKWNADAAEDVGTITLAVKTAAKGTTIRSLPIKLRDVRPYVVLVKFEDDNWAGYEEDIADGAEFQYDAITAPHTTMRAPVCYVMGHNMQVEFDVAGSEKDETVNGLSAATEIEIVPMARYGGGTKSLTFKEKTIDGSRTTDWSQDDTSELESETSGAAGIVGNEVIEYEDFAMEWQFKVQNSAGAWVDAWPEPGYQTTIICETSGDRNYGVYLIYAKHKCADAQFKKAYLDDAVLWARKNPVSDDEANIAYNVCLALRDESLTGGWDFEKPDVSATDFKTFETRWSMTANPPGADGDCAGWAHLMIDVLAVLGIGPYVMDYVNEHPEGHAPGVTVTKYPGFPAYQYYHPTDLGVKCPACGSPRYRSCEGGSRPGDPFCWNRYQGVCKKGTGQTCYSVQGPHIGTYEQLDNSVSYPNTSHTENLNHAFAFYAWVDQIDYLDPPPLPIDESPGTQVVTLLSAAAAAGQPKLRVASVAGFTVGDSVVIQDDSKSEYGVVLTIDAPKKEVTLAQDLKKAYSPSANGRMRKGHIKEPDDESSW